MIQATQNFFLSPKLGALALTAILSAPGIAVGEEPIPDAATMLETLLEQDARLSRLIDRDSRLLELLNENPDMVTNMANWGPLHVRTWRALTDPWVIFGFGAQGLFMVRFVIQWVVSERKKRSYVPVIFWYFSIAGGVTMLIYAIHRRDPVFMVGQSLGLLIYTRNLVLIYRRKWAYEEVLAERAEKAGGLDMDYHAPASAAESSPV